MFAEVVRKKKKKIGEAQIRSNIWRLNEEYYTIKRIKEELEQFFRVNDTGYIRSHSLGGP